MRAESLAIASSARPGWLRLSAALEASGPAPCQVWPAEMWWAQDGRMADEAEAHCHRCPVKGPCLGFALANDERHGIWGAARSTERPR